MRIEIVLNGEERELERGSTVADAIVEAGGDPGARGIAVAVDGVVVPRAELQERELGDGARVEVVMAIQGGS